MAEAWRNLTAVGAKPLAITDCLNFGNPEKPEIMGQFAGCLKGMAEACAALEFPVVSGNVSFYNETNGIAVPPTPAIGGVGLVQDVDRMASPAIRSEGEVLIVVGETSDGQHGWLGQSLYLREIGGREDGAPPPMDLAKEKRTGDFVRGLIEQGLIASCHDISDGGLLVAVAEMAMAGDIGATIEASSIGVPSEFLHAWLFGEDQGRYVVCVPASEFDSLRERAETSGVPFARIGVTGSKRLTVDQSHSISLTELRQAHERWFPQYMAVQ